jgi:hypothetical protein
MPELFEPVAPLVRILVLGRTLEVPPDETLLRQLQFVAPEVAMGRFCWNGECRNCEVRYVGSTGVERAGLACILKGHEGIEVVQLSADLRFTALAFLDRPAPSADPSDPSRPRR